MKKKVNFLFLMMMLMVLPASATHYMGGEIIWECLPNGNFRFIMKVYRECYTTSGDSAASYLNPEQLTGPFGNITMYLYPNAVQGKKDMSPTCHDDALPHYLCGLPSTAGMGPNLGATEEWTYTSDQAHPNGVMLNGVPPANGWTFYWDGCCRNSAANYSGQPNWYLRAKMYPYNGLNTYPCFDNSPRFLARPNAALPVGYPFTYNHNGADWDRDSLSFEFDQALTGAGAQVPYTATFSALSPLPGTTLNPLNVPAAIDPYTGEISFTSYTQGAYITVTKVSSYRCGIKIAEVFREIQVALLPGLVPEFPGSSNMLINLPPEITLQDVYTGQTILIDTVWAGKFIQYDLVAFDTAAPFSLVPNNVPVAFNYITLAAGGVQFGQNFSSTTTGCPDPPCATLNPTPDSLDNFQSVFLSTDFAWQTTCAHLETSTGCGGVTNTYTFVVNVKDAVCPVSANNFYTFTIVVENPILKAPVGGIKCISVLPNGDVSLEWGLPDTSNIYNLFNSYHLYTSTNINGPYIVVDSIFSFNSTTYTHVGANANNLPRYYFLRTRSGCGGRQYSEPTDTVRAMSLAVSNVGNNTAQLLWNPIHTPLPATTSGVYQIYLEDPNGNWDLVGSTPSLSFLHYVPSACGLLNYRVALYDSSGCTSYSSIDNDMFRNAYPPELRCVSTDRDGIVTLTWNMPTDSITINNFTSYHILHSLNPNGPFVVIDSVTDVNLNTYSHTWANGNSTINYYMMVTNVDCDGPFSSGNSDTLRNIVTNVVNTTNQSGAVSWNHPRIPLLPTQSSWYQIYREYPAGVWELMDSTQQLSFADTLRVCHDTVNYRVELYDSSGCVSVSSTSGAYYADPVSPDVPVLQYVTIDTVISRVQMEWTPSTAPDVVGYIIFYYNGVYNAIDTVWEATTTTYTDYDVTHLPCEAPQEYVIASFDSCGNTSPMGVDHQQTSIYLEITGYDPCEDIITLGWNQYKNLKPELLGYRIYVSENGSPFSLLGVNLAPGGGAPPSNTFVHKGLNKDSEYCYYVEAYNPDSLRSVSCHACIIAEKASPPNFLYIRYATVEDDDHIRLQLFVDTTAATREYKILRAPSANGPYEVIGVIPFTKTADITFEDHAAYFKRQSYFYKVVSVDTCGVDVYTSELARTIFLTAEPNDNFSNYLEWNDYEGWNWASVQGYNIYRVVDGMADPIPVSTLPYGSTHFIDDVSGLTETQGKFSYLVEAIQGSGIPDFADTSLSNVAKLLQRSRIFVPNAFSPKGYNNTFKPIQVFVDLSEYEFRIFNRWGQELFWTRNPEGSWDGSYDGSLVPAGVYVYYIRFITSTGDEFEKRGSVTVVY